jgi:hypothetical protein
MDGEHGFEAHYLDHSESRSFADLDHGAPA